MTKPTNRKKEFRRQFNNQLGISVEEQPDKRISAWNVQTPVGSKVVWMHYNKYFHMWTGSYSTGQKLAPESPLVYAFLGPDSDQYYIVPDSDLHDKFTLYDQDDGRGWVLSAAKEAVKTKENANVLEEYRSLSPLTG